ncbi:MAG TPA: DEAD/DEAH box helicase [Candidatus Acidoferrales bacterium]|nr:DEAD/DEAH box helicase [Candidatus Acidoferrales bacterium]
MNPQSLSWAHPIVQKWFTARFGSATEPQEQGWPHILAKKTTLISAPTGSGKTLAAFLTCIDRLVRKAIAGELSDTTQVLYVSPLKALGNDIQKNLEQPLGEILALAGQHGYLMPEIRTAVRTGDTLMKDRRLMLKRPPHILVTTPESLYILLTAQKSREVLKTVETVIVDEIHAIADDKRGTHLALSLERLETLTERPLVRVGLSATQKPIELVAHFLAGTDRADPVIVQVGHQRVVDLAVEVPRSELSAVTTHEMWDEIYDRLAQLIEQHRSTLIFVNTRRLAERVAHHLAERIGKEAVATHHGSLSRKIRLEAERKLKVGEVKALVATASLELGIDIGTVDLVCQLGTPRAIAVAWQRIGRSGHWHGAIPKGRIFATTRNELIECAALVRAMRMGDLDRLSIPENALDILAQQIVATCASEDWSEDELFALVRRAYPYRSLQRSEFDEVITMLSEGINARRGRYGAYLHRDRVNGMVRARRGSRLAAITSGGAIPDNALYAVIAEPEGAHVGTLDEDFAVESLRGDIVLLGNNSWRIRRVESSRVLVEDAHGAAPSVPFWRGEAPARTIELSQHVSDVRQKISDLTEGTPYRPPLRDFDSTAQAFHWLETECGLDRSGAEQAVEYIVAGKSVLSRVPTHQTVIAERFFDESGGMQLVIHAPFGGRINKAWGLALRKRFCRSFNLELQAAATEEGLNIALSDQHSFPLADVFRFLHPASVEKVLEQAVLTSPLFTTRWRWDASRALALLRFQGGRKVPPQIQRMRADDLLAAVFPDAAACQENIQGEMKIPDHPLIREVMKDALTEAMDVEGLKDVLGKILDGSIRCLAIDTPVPSQFSHEILNANPFAYLDDAPLEERRARAVEMRRVLPETVASDMGRLDPAAIEEVRSDAWPDVRDAEELHDALETLLLLPEIPAAASVDSENRAAHGFARIIPLAFAVARSIPAWQKYFDELVAQGRAGKAQFAGGTYWVVAERTKSVAKVFPGIVFDSSLAQVEQPDQTREEVMYAILSGWLQHSGPVHARDLASLLGLPESELNNSLLRVESSGAILRGQFTEARSGNMEWCERRLLSRIHRLTIGKLRKEIEPVTAAQFMRWLARWQRVASGTLALGERGVLDVLRQLQGYEAPANAWESEILSRRVANYDPATLDDLCLKGVVGWGRLSPHPAMLHDRAERTRRIVPTSIAPITFFVRDDAEWMAVRHHSTDSDKQKGLSRGAKDVLNLLAARGALFFADIVRGTKKLKSEVEGDLWELVAAGMITADGFDNLRALIDPKRRAGQGKGRTVRPRDSGGRWSLLFTDKVDDRTPAIESTCWTLLNRYGIVFRELLTRESIELPWREILIALRRLEDRGEIRGGRFVSGFLGEQFALPVAADSLRASRSQPLSNEVIRIAAADPLNLVGIILPGDRIPANSGRSFDLRDGVVVEQSPSAISVLLSARAG